MAIGSRIPVKSTPNQTDMFGSQPTTKARITEIRAVLGAAHRETLQASYAMITLSEREKWQAVYDADYAAEVLCQRGIWLHGAPRYSWIAGKVGLTILEVKKYLGKS